MYFLYWRIGKLMLFIVLTQKNSQEICISSDNEMGIFVPINYQSVFSMYGTKQYYNAFLLSKYIQEIKLA